MIDDNSFTVDKNEFEVCAVCGSTHVYTKDCPGDWVGRKKKKVVSWICDRICES
jgi:alpha-D-ribose 1-methylphosphonate 5-phosphate C-P lyase